MVDPIKLKRHSDENLKQWKLRICENYKEYGLSNWNEVAEVINKETGDKKGESAYRKWFTNFNEGRDYQKEVVAEGNGAIVELELKKIEVMEERKKLQAMKNEIHKKTRIKGRNELMYEHVTAAIENQPSLPLPSFKVLQPNHKQRAAILGFGDEHFGKEFKSLNNEYNEQIYLERMAQLLSETVETIQKESLNELVVLNGADSVEGMALRVSQLTPLQYGFMDQVIKYSRYKVEWLKELSKYVKIKYIHIPSANHTELRLHGTSRGEMPKEDVERIIATYIHDMLQENERIEVPLYDDGIVDFNLLEFEFVACHGHQIKNKKNAIRDLSQLKRKFYDYMYISHFHHGNMLTVGEAAGHNVQVIQLPSVMGSDEYSDSLMTGAKAGANLSIFESGKGRTIQYEYILN
ncbi:hypothetical protein HKK70_09230 [Bacillus safensis]|uniref:hypothetical protein n=1 Tax=Bacillus safensis TaxID=561879 RepID=UPI00146E1C7A|nr:hypothetical protein [Bacillus safensis]MCM3365924.1 hypothetical protein [Bacillus safensis]NMW01947.1 hypothetical protein [Bacillus safensis]